ncbi:MAG: TonB-dependent receptor, partial [Planctomycetes bacterium]|nr:TonB-dependent receptor [Planctomycetota bacterium]
METGARTPAVTAAGLLAAALLLAPSPALAGDEGRPAPAGDRGKPAPAPAAAPAAAPAPEAPPAEREAGDDAVSMAVEEYVGGPRAPELPEVTVTATRTRRDPFDLPQSISLFDAEEIAGPGMFVSAKGVAWRDAGIWFDERTSTTVDPIIRGFAGFNLLTLVDGNTLSTLWGEGGFGADDMYGKIDPEIVDRIEVIRGPSSALYGSNALGAVINVITRAGPIDFQEEGYAYGGRSKVTFGSAANAVGFRQEFFGAGEDFRYLVGGSARDFDDIRGGGDLGILEPSDGRERNWDFSGEMMVSDGRLLRLTVQDVHRDHVKRYYRPTQDNANDREAVGLFYEDSKGNATWDSLEARLYYQHKRDERRFFATDSEGRAVTVTYAGGLTATRKLGAGHVLTGGLAAELDRGDSPDDEQFTMTDPPPKSRAAPLSEWWNGGVFVQDEWEAHRRWSLLASARYDRMLFKTDVDGAYHPPQGDPQDDAIRENQGALTGGLGGVFKATEEIHLTGNWSRGFRQSAPNFGLRQLGDGVLIPNGLLDPTTSDNFELGLKSRSKGLRVDLAHYLSLIDNWQGDLRTVDSYNGSTWYDFNGNGVQDANEGYVQQTEGGDAFVKGFEARATWQPHAHVDAIPVNWSLDGSFAWNRGRVDGTDQHPEEEPLRHTQPMRLLLGLRWDETADPARGMWFEFRADMVGKYDDIPSDRAASDLAWREDPQDGTSGYLRDYIGTPGYTIFHLYGGMNLSKGTRVVLGIENLFDK